ncbi:hypothetical protein J6590_035987 [Homalodisca vitripennis]|nr:hypothetical protein J6590_035987 [Homalodisca vitripennis]
MGSESFAKGRCRNRLCKLLALRGAAVVISLRRLHSEERSRCWDQSRWGRSGVGFRRLHSEEPVAVVGRIVRCWNCET